MGGFAIGAGVALLWQHNANPSSKLASIPRYDGIVRTAGWAGSARVAGGRRSGDAPKTARRKRQAGRPARRRLAPDWGRSQHYCSSLECGLSTGGVLAIKSERKMLASTCLYSLYACLILWCRFRWMTCSDMPLNFGHPHRERASLRWNIVDIVQRCRKPRNNWFSSGRNFRTNPHKTARSRVDIMHSFSVTLLL